MGNGSVCTTCQQSHNEWLTIAILVEISGMDLTGEYFACSTRTEAVSSSGARIRLNQLLVPDQELTILRKRARIQVDARIVSQIGIDALGHLYALELLEKKNIWGIHFPPITHSPDPAIKAQLSRIAAAERSDDHLMERRKHPRSQISLEVCLRQPLRSEDSATLVDVSRGGIRFLSTRLYRKNTWVEVAVPYTRNSENLFVPAKLVWQNPGDKLQEYGLQYISPGPIRKG